MRGIAMPVRLSTKGQIVVPQKIRERLGLKAGDALVFVVGEGEAVLMTAGRYAEALRGAARGAFGRTRAEVDAFVRRERAAWRG